jgi:hypothetical protein
MTALTSTSWRKIFEKEVNQTTLNREYDLSLNFADYVKISILLLKLIAYNFIKKALFFSFVYKVTDTT